MITTTPPLIGSSWDVAAGPDGLLPKHLGEWVNRSAVAPELAAANVDSLAGPDVLEALAGHRLASLAGDGKRYATAAVTRILQPLWPLAASGGWWCSGLDPLDGWAPMAWGCFRPDVPRWDQEKEAWRRYEHPAKLTARSFWLRVPASIARKVADRYGLELPPEVAADGRGDRGAFWRWWAQTPALPLLVTEGAKKAGACLSIGVPAVALPGIWNGAPKNPDTRRPELLAELAAVPLANRPVWVLFDGSDKPEPAEPLAADRLGRLLAAAGAAVLVGIVPGTHGKGADDHLAAGGSWEALAAALQPLGPRPVLPRLRPVLPRLRAADRVAPAGAWLGDALAALPEANGARLLALACPMGAGKSTAIRDRVAPLLAAGVRVVLITYRKSLGEALAADLGLPWADDAAPGRDLRHQGIALCIDSLCPGSRLRINPADWAGAVVIIDEAAAVLRHALQARETAIGRRRTAVLATLAQLLQQAGQILIADAQLDDATLEAIEAAAGDRALLIGSEHQPAAGRSLTVHTSRNSWQAQLVALLQARKRLWISTTAAKGDSPNAAQNLAILADTHWPDSRVLVVDADTVSDPEHDAHRLAQNPDTIAADYDVVIASPAIAAGLSVTIKNHFAAVLVCSGGTTEPAAIAQAAARVRDDCPRHLFAPERSPGNQLQIGSGSTDPAAVLQRLKEHHQLTLAQLVAAGWNPTTNDSGPWLQLWARQAAYQNGARLRFRATVVGLLEREGYIIQTAAPLDAVAASLGEGAGKLLAEVAQQERDAQQERIITAELLTDAQARELQARRRRLSPAERAQLQRWRIARSWGLGQAPPTTEILKAHEDGMPRRVVFAWAVTDPAAAPLIAAHDRQQAQLQAPDGRAWAPDLCADALGPGVAVAQSLGLPAWLQRGQAAEWFTADDPALLELHATVTAHGGALTQTLGLKPGKNATTVLRQLLALAGHRLESRQIRNGPERGRWRYRVVPLPMPHGTTAAQLVTAWREALAWDGTKIPIQK